MPRRALAPVLLLLLAALAAVAVRARLSEDGRSGPAARPADGGAGGGSAAVPLDAGSPLAEASPEDRAAPGDERASVPGPDDGLAPGAAGPGAAIAVVRGRVLDARGRSVGAAEVLALPGEGAPPAEVFALDTGGAGPAAARRTRTGADGAFELRGLGAGALRLSVRAPGFAPLDRAGLAVPSRGELDLGALVLADGVVLPGRVIGASGAPVAGAELLHERSGEVPLALHRKAVPLAVSGTDGSFRVEVLAPGPWRFRVRHPAHPDGLFEGECERPGLAEAVELRLSTGAAISGRALGAPAGLVAELSVLAVPEELSSAHFGAGVEEGRSEPRRAPVEFDGSFQVDGLRVDQRYRLMLVDGLEPRSLPVEAIAGERDVELRYAAGATLTLRVVDARTRAPVEHLTVRHGPWAADRGEPEPAHHADGIVVLAAVQPAPGIGSYSVALEAEGYGAEAIQVEGLAVGERRDLGDVALEPRGVIFVRVRDAGSGRPVEGARVHLLGPVRDPAEGAADPWGPGGRARRSARTDASGLARVTRGAVADEELVVVARGRAPHFAEAPALPLAPGAPAESLVLVELTPGAEVRVRVVDDAGAPLAGVPVAHRRNASTEEWTAGVLATSTVPTDAEGRARFEHLEAGEHRFRAEPPVRGESAPRGVLGARDPEGEWRSVLVPAAGVAELELVVPVRASVRGVTVAGGLPLAGARVELAAPESVGDPWRPPGPAATTGADGGFELLDAATGPQVLIVTHPARAMDHREAIDVPRGGLEVRVELPVASVAGRVTVAGAPSSGVRVLARRAADGEMRMPVLVTLDAAGGVHALGDPGEVTASTDAEGRYRLLGVATEVPLAISFEAEHVVRERLEGLEIAPGEARAGVDVALAPAGSIEVAAARADGGPIGFCLVEARRIDGPDVEQESAFLAGGAVRLGGLAPGTWRVTLRAAPGSGEKFPPKASEVVVVAGETASVSFDVPAPGS